MLVPWDLTLTFCREGIWLRLERRYSVHVYRRMYCQVVQFLWIGNLLTVQVLAEPLYMYLNMSHRRGELGPPPPPPPPQKIYTRTHTLKDGWGGGAELPHFSSAYTCTFNMPCLHYKKKPQTCKTAVRRPQKHSLGVKNSTFSWGS